MSDPDKPTAKAIEVLQKVNELLASLEDPEERDRVLKASFVLHGKEAPPPVRLRR